MIFRYLYNSIYSLLFICATSITPSTINQPKFCVNCKYYVKDLGSFSKLDRCSQFVKKEPEDEITNKRDKIKYLITGIKVEKPKKPIDYFLCETARELNEFCGLDGRKYEPFSE